MGYNILFIKLSKMYILMYKRIFFLKKSLIFLFRVLKTIFQEKKTYKIFKSVIFFLRKWDFRY